MGNNLSIKSELQNKLKALAALDAIIEPEWEYRYFSYDSNWAVDEEMASMRDGQGGHWFILFKNELIGYKCISPEDGLMDNLEDIKDNLPEEYLEFINEPAFYVNEASSIWILNQGQWVKFGKDIVYLIDLAQIENWTACNYKKWADEYYERDFDLNAIESVFKHKVDKETISKLNPVISIEDLEKDFKEIGLF